MNQFRLIIVILSFGFLMSFGTAAQTIDTHLETVNTLENTLVENTKASAAAAKMAAEAAINSKIELLALEPDSDEAKNVAETTLRMSIEANIAARNAGQASRKALNPSVKKLLNDKREEANRVAKKAAMVAKEAGQKAGLSNDEIKIASIQAGALALKEFRNKILVANNIKIPSASEEAMKYSKMARKAGRDAKEAVEGFLSPEDLKALSLSIIEDNRKEFIREKRVRNKLEALRVAKQVAKKEAQEEAIKKEIEAQEEAIKKEIEP